MDACVRHMDLHVEYEPEWESAFTLQLKFADALSMFQDWCRADVSSNLTFGINYKFHVIFNEIFNFSRRKLANFLILE